jgi:hypothetical protein
MKKQFLSGWVQCCMLLPLLTASAHGQIKPLDTVVPNRFDFVSAQYFVSRGATDAVITVRFSPGSRSWSGSVNYATHDGTGIANQDYAAVSGSLSFSGIAYRSFTVPLTAGPLDQPRMILLVLAPSPSDPNAIILRSNAVLHINLPPPPNIAINLGPNGTVLVSWPDDGTEPLLEKRVSSGTTWNALPPVTSDSNGRCCYAEACSTGMALYRLRRAQ